MPDDPEPASSHVPSASKHAGPSIEVPPGMSKNAAKKLARQQKREATKHERRAAERLKKKQNKRARFLSAQTPAGTADASNKRRASETSNDVEAKGGKRQKPERDGDGGEQKEYFDARLVIDCGFEELMAEKESNSMMQQLMYLYSANRNAKVPFGEVILTGQERPGDCLRDVDPEQLPLVPQSSATAVEDHAAEASSGKGSIEKNRIGKAMDGKLRGVWRRWKRVTIYKNGGIESLLSSTDAEAAPSSCVPDDKPSTSGPRFACEEERQALHRVPISEAIYLTADTDDTLDTLESGKTYIIGGIVDKNRYKGLCRAKADRLGIRAAKLPLSQEMLQAVEHNVRSNRESIQDEQAEQDAEKGFVGRKVLTVNQVVEILTAWTETRDWVKALEKALPRRKLKQRGPLAKCASDSASARQEAPKHTKADEEDEARNGS